MLDSQFLWLDLNILLIANDDYIFQNFSYIITSRMDIIITITLNTSSFLVSMNLSLEGMIMNVYLSTHTS